MVILACVCLQHGHSRLCLFNSIVILTCVCSTAWCCRIATQTTSTSRAPITWRGASRCCPRSRLCRHSGTEPCVTFTSKHDEWRPPPCAKELCPQSSSKSNFGVKQLDNYTLYKYRCVNAQSKTRSYGTIIIRFLMQVLYSAFIR